MAPPVTSTGTGIGGYHSMGGITLHPPDIDGATPRTALVQVVPPREMTPAELLKHDGSDPALPLMLSIEGVVFNITKGQQFYGPGGEA